MNPTLLAAAYIVIGGFIGTILHWAFDEEQSNGTKDNFFAIFGGIFWPVSILILIGTGFAEIAKFLVLAIINDKPIKIQVTKIPKAIVKKDR